MPFESYDRRTAAPKSAIQEQPQDCDRRTGHVLEDLVTQSVRKSRLDALWEDDGLAVLLFAGYLWNSSIWQTTNWNIRQGLALKALKDGGAMLWTVGDVGVARVAESGLPS